jgi:hypothetical protein
MKLTNIHTKEEGEVWINFDQPIVITEDGDFTIVSVACGGSCDRWWKFSTDESPRSIIKRAARGEHLDNEPDGFISKDLK